MPKRLTTTKNGKTERILREEICSIQEICGKCTLIELPYKEQLNQKVLSIKEKILALGANFHHVSVKDCTPAPAKLGYRNYVYLMISDYKSNPKDESAAKRRINIGFYQSSLRRIIDIGRCPVLMIPLNHILAWLRTGIRIHNVSIYQPRTKVGLLRGIILSISPKTNHVSLCFVVTKLQSAELRPLACDIIAKFANVRGISMKLDDDKENKNIKLLAGHTTSLEETHPNILAMEKIFARLDDLKKQYSAHDSFAIITTNHYVLKMKQCFELKKVLSEKPRIVCLVSSLSENTKNILNELHQNHYNPLFVEPFDVLPETDYCETIFVFEREKQ